MVATNTVLSSARLSSMAPQHMYILEGGLLVASNLLKTNAWVHDADRTHCNVCVQQFMAFRRRHHCRTCGEVVCGACSAQRKIHLIEVNVECATRVCSFCMIRATDASIHANETAMRETMTMAKRASLRSSQAPSLAADRTHNSDHNPKRTHPRPPLPNSQHPLSVHKTQSMQSMESELTEGSVVQLWPNLIPAQEQARLQIVRNSTIQTTEHDPTMTLLVSIVARTLECPVAFIGILDDAFLWLKASVGWDRTHIPRDDCVCAVLETTLIVPDTNRDKHFLASTLAVENEGMRYYAGAPIRVCGQCIGAVCAIDTVVHRETTSSMQSTLEAVANIVSEVLEQRVDGMGSNSSESSGSSFYYPAHPSRPSTINPSNQNQIPTTPNQNQRSLLRTCSSVSSASTLVHGEAFLPDESSISSMDSDAYDDDEEEFGNALAVLRSTKSSPYSSTRFSLSLSMPLGPPDLIDHISKALSFFQSLQHSRWMSQGNGDEDVATTSRSFEVWTQQRHFTKTHVRLASECARVISHVQSYEDARVYAHVFAHVSAFTDREWIGTQTWFDQIQMTASDSDAISRSDIRLVSHWRQYPDGSHVIVAFNDSNTALRMAEDFVFGWYIAPCPPHPSGETYVHISCIVAQPEVLNNGANQTPTQNQSQHLLHQLEMALNDNQQSHVYDTTDRRPRSSHLNTETPKVVSIRSPTLATSLNGNERMMLDLLDKTISTQEVLAAQQHAMATVIDYHGSQLERISHAIDRVEHLLQSNNEPLRPQLKTHVYSSPMGS